MVTNNLPSNVRIAIASVQCRGYRELQSTLFYGLLAVALVTFAVIGRAAGFEDPSLKSWTAASEVWMRGQITPNRVVPSPDPSRRQLLVSYALSPQKSPYGYHRSAIYDDALGALCLLIRGDPERAASILNALARLVRPDGSLWFGYNTANDWPSELDHQSALVRAGALSWVGYALAFYLVHAPPCAAGNRGCEQEHAFFLGTANHLAEYLSSLQIGRPGDPRDGLLRLGYGTIHLEYREDAHQVVERYLDKPALEVSTENNISAWFFLRQLAALGGPGGPDAPGGPGWSKGNDRWRTLAERIRQGLLRGAWNDTAARFNEGFDIDGTPDPVKALDCSTWGMLFLLAAGEPEKAKRALASVDSLYATRDGVASGYRPYSDTFIFTNPAVARFFFPTNPRKRWSDISVVWAEGSLGVALAHFHMGDTGRARRIIEGLRPLRITQGGMRYASREVPHVMSNAPSVVATAWLVLVAEALRGNPLAERVWN